MGNLGPVPGLAAATEHTVDGRVHEHGFHGVGERRCARVSGRNRLPDANAACLGISVKLGYIETGVEDDSGDGFWRLVDEHANPPHVGWYLFADHGSTRVRDVARAFAIEIESDGGGSSFDGGECIFAIGDSAD